MRSDERRTPGGTLKARIMAVLLAIAPLGVTDEQLHRVVGGRFSSVKSARLRLVWDGMVEASAGARQPTSWCRLATAWKATTTARRFAAPRNGAEGRP